MLKFVQTEKKKLKNKQKINHNLCLLILSVRWHVSLVRDKLGNSEQKRTLEFAAPIPWKCALQKNTNNEQGARA